MTGLDAGKRVLVCLAGDLDQSTVPAATSLIREALAPANSVSIDMGAVTFFSAAGVRMLVELLNQGLEVELVDASHQTLRVLQICGLSDRFIFHNTNHDGSSTPALR